MGILFSIFLIGYMENKSSIFINLTTKQCKSCAFCSLTCPGSRYPFACEVTGNREKLPKKLVCDLYSARFNEQELNDILETL